MFCCFEGAKAPTQKKSQLSSWRKLTYLALSALGCPHNAKESKQDHSQHNQHEVARSNNYRIGINNETAFTLSHSNKSELLLKKT